MTRQQYYDLEDRELLVERAAYLQARFEREERRERSFPMTDRQRLVAEWNAQKGI